MLVSSVPISLTTIAGRARSAIAQSSSRATRSPEIEVSAISRTHSRVKSSITAKIRNRRPQAKRVGGEVERPALVAPLRDRHRCAGPQCPLAAAAAHLEPLLAIQAPELLVVDRYSLASQQPVQAAMIAFPLGS